MRMSKLRFAAASLIVSLSASPMVLDACLVTCHGSTTVDEASAEPSCHHATATDDGDVRLEAPATACGHDHSSSSLALTSSSRDAGAKSDATVLVAESAVSVATTHLEVRGANASTFVATRCRTDNLHLRI
jgi:hypothetical protein